MENSYFLILHIHTHVQVYILGRMTALVVSKLHGRAEYREKNKTDKQNSSKTLVYNILLFVNVEVIDYFPTILFDGKLSGKSLSLSYNSI